VVLEPIHDQFVRRLVQAAASLKVGDPSDPGTRVGPVISAEARDRILRYIEQGTREARLAFPEAARTVAGASDARAEDGAGLDQLSEPGYFIQPHVFVDVPPEATIAQEEIFGPVLAVLKAHDFSHALELALGVRYGLTGGLYSRNPARIARAYREFRVGNLYINRPITGAMVGRQPFGGSRMSGVGSKAGGPDYLLQFLEPRVITENTIRRGFAPDERSPSPQSR
jgi:RHH-type proline utilization regulon transcriptional repressor/proline dehydrogenase/delta 1-pyrroline-5-carboxylate dehydrogenase